MKMKRLIAAIGLAAAASGSLAAEPEAPEIPVQIVYRVKQQGGGLGHFVDEAVVVSAAGTGAARVWVAERRWRETMLGKVSMRAEWIDSRACPALATALTDLSHLSPADFAPPTARPSIGVTDTPEVTVIGPVSGGSHVDRILRRDLAGPVSRWWWTASKALASCWQAAMPYIPGAYGLRARLASADDEVEAMRP